MGQGRARVFNLLTLLIVLATTAFAVVVVLRMMQPPPERVVAQVAVPTLQQLPTVTPSHTPTNTPLPSFTPSPTAVPPTIPPTGTPTFTLVPIIPTLAPTLTPIPTETPVTPTSTGTLPPTIPPSSTPVPSATITLTLPASATSSGPLITQQATVPPPSPFPFMLKDWQVIFIPNSLNAAGCAWQGLGGQVFDVNNLPFTQVRVHVFGNGLDVFAQAGSNTLYGPSGWEVQVGNFPSGNTYQVELQTLNGTIVSQPIAVVFTANDCQLNLALVNFMATR